MYIVKDKQLQWSDGSGNQYLYTGEVDLSDELCGSGSLVSIDDPNNKYQGTFLNGDIHGFGKSICMQDWI